MVAPFAGMTDYLTLGDTMKQLILSAILAAGLAGTAHADDRLKAAIDGKHPLWEGPRYQVTLLCRFQEQASDGVWQALVRTPDRCGDRRRPHQHGPVLGQPQHVVA